jgi:hypothetical protein
MEKNQDRHEIVAISCLLEFIFIFIFKGSEKVLRFIVGVFIYDYLIISLQDEKN